MTLTITLSSEAEQTLADRAARSGQSTTEFARDLIERSLRDQPTVADILAPFRREVAESGATDEELDRLFEEARDEAWRERQGR